MPMPNSQTDAPRTGPLNMVLQPFYRLLDALCQVSLVVSGTAMVTLTVIFGWLVFGRYVLNATPTWVEQVSLLLVALIGFLGASTGVHERSHLGVSFFRAPHICRRTFQSEEPVIAWATIRRRAMAGAASRLAAAAPCRWRPT